MDGHGVGGGFELRADAPFRAASFSGVAVDAAGEADVVRGVYVDGEVEERAQVGVVEGEDAFDDDEGVWGDFVEGAGDAGVGAEVVNGPPDGVAVGERADVGDEELGLEGVGVVKVAFVAGVEGELREVTVVEVERKEGGVEGGGELFGEGGFAGAAAAADAEEDRAAGEAQLLGLLWLVGWCG